jgi:hypothetical protein
MRRPQAPRNKSEIRRSKPRAAVFPIPRFSIIHRLATSKAEFKLVASLSFEPMEAKKPRPIWEPRNLADHVSKRSLVDVGCLESLLGLEGQLLIGNLRHLSEEVYSQPRFVYEAEMVELGGGFRDRRSYFVDARLVMAVTDQQRTAFITCYHLHKTFSRACPGASQDEQETSRRLLAEKQRLLDLPSDKIRNLRFLKS